MPVRTTFEWPDPDDDEPGQNEFFPDPFEAEIRWSETTTDSLNSHLVEFSDSDIDYKNLDQDETT